MEMEERERKELKPSVNARNERKAVQTIKGLFSKGRNTIETIWKDWHSRKEVEQLGKNICYRSTRKD